VETTALLQLEEMLFPVMEMHTNAKHDLQGERAGTLLQYGQELQRIDGQPGKYGLMISVRSDNEKSKNPPYSFAIEAHAILSVVNGSPGTEDELAFVRNSGLPLVMGAIRERLADMTARAPWGRFLINAVPVQEPLQIRSI
jgi:hypothetical protein